ncbi:MAG: hypothetical protein EBU90_07755 [Proteobacteria bacterium]|nr:hypothetical protein [Pseudomonadota bacterium]NBP14093.1 hypothetical protein [bacterium]
MKIKIVSDLHLEFSPVIIPNNGADVLILSGDILVAQDLHEHKANDVELDLLSNKQKKVKGYRDFLKQVSEDFQHVLYVAGNHEFYHGKWIKTFSYIREEIALYPNIYFLENESKEIDDVLFVGGTLWTDMNNRDPSTMFSISNLMNDFRVIRHDGYNYRKVNANDCVKRHEATLGYFKEVLDRNTDSKCVVVSHMAPTFASIGSRYITEKIMNGGYASNLGEFILDRPQIKLWTHGHVHDPADYMVGTTRVVCNPRGYEGYEETGWDLDLLIEV